MENDKKKDDLRGVKSYGHSSHSIARRHSPLACYSKQMKTQDKNVTVPVRKKESKKKKR